ncbi:uncharacterized protein LOC125841998 isoform X2 [Solanum stenotomum]|uniref:uncharacterized protein LOC125841998 isoform X2 n=1 Tax=Solanum stenotomum TaxID=172797 RepID=UPI0020CFFBFF|nr:uncharacterized protein LOC125841998 isoform X2 [Solanum stenotomum]
MSRFEWINMFSVSSLIYGYLLAVITRVFHSQFPIITSGVFLLTGNFSSSSWHSSSDIQLLPFELQSRNSMRKIWTFSPLCIGRRSCKIAGKKV